MQNHDDQVDFLDSVLDQFQDPNKEDFESDFASALAANMQSMLLKSDTKSPQSAAADTASFVQQIENTVETLASSSEKVTVNSTFFNFQGSAK